MHSRQEIFASLEMLLSSAAPGGLVIIDDSRNRESSMSEERRAQSHFFNHILPKLKATYGEMSPEKEDEVIDTLVTYVEKKLAAVKDRSGEIVGPLRARNAVLYDNDRKLGTINVNGHCSFDDIGRYHTILRLLKNDTNIAGYWRTPYLARDTAFTLIVDRTQQNYRYRELLSYIWLGAQEDNIVAPSYADDIPPQQLREISKDAVLTELAQNRREHNFDNQSNFESELDYQTCDIGFRGRMFGRMLIWNKKYVESDTQFNLPELQSVIQEAIINFIAALPLEEKQLVLCYLDDVFAMYADPAVERKEAMDRFIDRSKAYCL